jgi:hypothetical protein
MTVVLTVPSRRVRRRHDPVAPANGRTPAPDRVARVARMIALAHHWRGLVRSGVVRDQAALAQLVGVTRARITQVMGLLHLAPEIQEAVLLPPTESRGAEGTVTHRELLSIAAEPAWSDQRRRWRSRGVP